MKIEDAKAILRRYSIVGVDLDQGDWNILYGVDGIIKYGHIFCIGFASHNERDLGKEDKEKILTAIFTLLK